MTPEERPARPPLAVIGLYPPPVHGQSVLTDKIASFFETSMAVERISLGGASAFSKIAMHMRAALRLLTMRGRRPAYSTPPGQMGLWLFLMVVLAARLRRRLLLVHHHSFRAVSSGPLLSMRMVNALGGEYLHHVFLGERMREGFWRLYKAPRGGAKASLLPNAFAYPPPVQSPSPRSGPLTLGHISILTEEKGVARAIAIFERLRAQGRDVKLVLAGPIADKRLRPVIEAVAARQGGAFDYRGPVYDAAKSRFFAGIDLMLLPSSLVDEADPLVIQEAYEAGADVMASDRGCISERLRRPDAFLMLDAERDTAAVARVLDDLALNRATAPELNWRHAREMHLRARAAAENLLDELMT